MTKYILNNNLEIPKIGFGTWQAKGNDAYQSVLDALEVGYRHIDTAQVYGNEEEVGRAIKDSGVPREDIFLTTKIWNDKHSYELALESVQESLKKLQTDYVDLLLIHWPNPITLRENDAWKEANQETWKAMEELVEKGQVRSIGVSNFMIHHLESLLEKAIITPAVNQVMLAPGCAQLGLDQYCNERGILLEAYSPLGTSSIFENKEIKELAEKYDRNVAQVALRWSLQHGFLPLPKSTNKAHIASNLEIFDFELSGEDVAFLDTIDGGKVQSNPDERDF